MSNYFEIAVDLIKKHEGFRSLPYRDTRNNLTIGYGLNLTEWGTKGISRAEAEAVLRAQLSIYEQELKNAFRNFDELDDIRKAVLLDMAYNLGVPGLLKFKNMFAALKEGNFAKAAEEMLNSRWAQQVKTRATYLAELMQYGNQLESSS